MRRYNLDIFIAIKTNQIVPRGKEVHHRKAGDITSLKTMEKYVQNKDGCKYPTGVTK